MVDLQERAWELRRQTLLSEAITKLAHEAGFVEPLRVKLQSVELALYDRRSDVRVAIHQVMRDRLEDELGTQARIITRTIYSREVMLTERFVWVAAIAEDRVDG